MCKGLLETSLGTSSGLHGGPEKCMTTSSPLDPTNVTFFGKRDVIFFLRMYLRISRSDHLGLSERALHLTTSILKTEEKTVRRRECHAKTDTKTELNF